MSQITRCPSCSTTFKVVADQLRISEGWVRCGQCKEVFDASAYLLAAAPPALLPDVSLTDIRPPPTPVARPPETERAWGGPPIASAAAAISPKAEPARAWGAADDGVSSRTSSLPAASASPAMPPSPASPFAPVLDAGPAAPPSQPQNLDAQPPDHARHPLHTGFSEAAAPMLEVPQPAVPAFLAAAPTDASIVAPLELARDTPFSWRPRSPGGASPTTGMPEPDGFGRAATSGREGGPATASAPLAPPIPGHVPTSRAPFPSLAAGYELPAADPPEDDAAMAPAAAVGLTPMGYPALELPVRPVTSSKAPPPVASLDAATTAPDAAAQPDPPEPLPPVDFARPAAPQDVAPEALMLVEDDPSRKAVLQALSRKPSAPAGANGGDDDEEVEADPEVSFVRAARRQAFWRKPQVRVALAAMILLALAGLALQVAIQERDWLVARDARLRPMLVALCAPLQCEIAPPRQIADIVIDSSSFNKARGDSYQLAMTMKSKASIPLAMPAVELTLTDAQDQPMLRRVLLPTDLGAPMELPSGGEWSASVSVIVTTGGARVAGYRLLAFYP